MIKRVSKNIYLKFVNAFMTQGHQFRAEELYYRVLEELKQLSSKRIDPLKILRTVIDRLEPALKTRPRIIAGKTYNLPAFEPSSRGETRALQWLVRSIRTKVGISLPLEKKIANEIWNVYNSKQSSHLLALTYKDELSKVIKDNRPFMRYAKRKVKKRRKNF